MPDGGRMLEIEGLWKQGKRMESLEALAAYLEDHPDDGAAWSRRGLYLLDLDEPRRLDALEALDRSLRITPSYPAAYNAGNALLDLERYEEALERYELSIRCFDGYPQAWVNRGITLTRLDRRREGIASFDRALSLDPAFMPAQRCKAIGLEQLGEKVASEETYARMVELEPDNVHVLSEYGRALSRPPPDNHMELEPHGREWKAVEALTTVIERNPSDVRAWLAKAEVLYRCMHANVCFRRSVLDYVMGPLRTGSFQDDLHALLLSALERYPERVEFHRYMADLHAFRDDAAAELACRERVCELLPNDDAARAELREVRERLATS